MQPPPAAQGIRVLVCDDVEPLLLAVEKTLKRRLPGVHVQQTTSAEHAFEVIRKDPPHALLTDFHLRGATGLDLAMRAHIERPAMGIGLMSAYRRMPLSLAALGAVGVDCFLEKPLNPVSLGQAVGYLTRTSPTLRARTRATGALHLAADLLHDDSPGDGAAPPPHCGAGHANAAGARYCSACGDRLQPAVRETFSLVRGDLQAAVDDRAHLADPRLLALYDRGLEKMRQQRAARAAAGDPDAARATNG